MELKNIDLEEFTKLYNDSFTPKRKVDKEEVRCIVSEFLYRGAFIMEVLIEEEDRDERRAIVMAFRDYINSNGLPAAIHQRNGRVFLRNDSVPLCVMVGYPRGIVNASKRNRWRIKNC